LHIKKEPLFKAALFLYKLNREGLFFQSIAAVIATFNQSLINWF